MSFSNLSVGIHNICLLIVKRVEISLREFIVRGHQFSASKENTKKRLKNRMKEKACQQMSFTDRF